MKTRGTVLGALTAFADGLGVGPASPGARGPGGVMDLITRLELDLRQLGPHQTSTASGPPAAGAAAGEGASPAAPPPSWLRYALVGVGVELGLAPDRAQQLAAIACAPRAYPERRS